MTHRFPIKEIARQAGLGTATVDRAINNRAHVSPQTRARVRAAVAELEAQEQQLFARGRRMFVDVIVEAPARFYSQIRSACEAVLPGMADAVFRPRFRFQEQMSDGDMTALLNRVKKRGSDGVFLKARDVPAIRECVDALEAAGIPVITLVTDIAGSNRTAYVGLDNAKAGRTAAFLLANVLPESRGTILTSRSRMEFRGEEERYIRFREFFLELRPGYDIVEVTGGGGLAGETTTLLGSALERGAAVDAVYSMGGGNRTILDVLKAEARRPRHFIAHDLDSENLALLQSGHVSFVLHHDLKLDMRRAFRTLATRHTSGRSAELPSLSDVQIITPHNLPEV